MILTFIQTDRQTHRQINMKTLPQHNMVSKYGCHSVCMSHFQLYHNPTGVLVFIQIAVV